MKLHNQKQQKVLISQTFESKETLTKNYWGDPPGAVDVFYRLKNP